jgi:hypothetical protein
MDEGAEGFTSLHRRRDGGAVSHRSEICGVVPTDQSFATDKYAASAAGRATLQNFSQTANAFGFMIYGHTDGRASDECNMRLSSNRANAFAGAAQSIGGRVVDVKGYGERQPGADNNSAAGMQEKPSRRNLLHPMKGSPDMKIVKLIGLLVIGGALAACQRMRPIDAEKVAAMRAICPRLWLASWSILKVATIGSLTTTWKITCQNVRRLTSDCRPVCSGVATPNTAVGPFKAGSPIPDFV